MTMPIQEPLKPAGWWYGVGGGLIGLGILASILIFVFAFQGAIDEFEEIEDDVDALQRVPAPGQGEIELPAPGEYTVYLEGSFTSTDTLVAPDIEIESTEPDSRPLPLSPVTFEFTSDFSGPAISTMFEFDAPEAGTYSVTVGEPTGGVSGVAIGEGLDFGGLIGSVAIAFLVPMGVGGILGLAGLVVIIVVAVRRSSAQRRRRQAQMVGAYGSPPPSQPQAWPPAPPPPPPGVT